MVFERNTLFTTFTDTKSSSLIWIIKCFAHFHHYFCLNGIFIGNVHKKMRVKPFYDIFATILPRQKCCNFSSLKAVLFTSRTKAQWRQYYAGHIYLLLLTITFLMLDLSDLLKDCCIDFFVHQTMSYSSVNIWIVLFGVNIECSINVL